jgi:transcriptional regulator with XRE-family HTH domain
MSKLFFKKILKNIKKYRLQKNLTQRDLSLKTGISRSSIAMIETGKRDLTVSKIFQIAKALDIEAHELLK